MVNHFNTQGDAVSKLVNGVKNASKSQNRKVQYINFGEDDQMEIEGFVFNKVKASTVWIFYILTIGLLRLFFHWYPKFLLLATHSKCSLEKADKVLITDNYNGKVSTTFVKTITTLTAQHYQNGKDIDNNIFSNEKTKIYKLLKFRLADGSNKEVWNVRIIRCKKLTYVWDEERKKFIKLGGLENGIKRSDLHQFTGQSEKEQEIKRIVYGNNEIHVPVQTILTLLVLEALTPFYIFQLFSLTVWLCENYYYYTVAIVVMSVCGITTSIIQTRTNQKRLRGTVTLTAKATICRGYGFYEEVPTTDLVPGDVIVVPNECEMQCDAVLLQGSCIVNESMLTGESVPVTKSPLPKNNTLYNVKEDVNHTMFCGTKVIQTRCQGDAKVLAVVVRTGYLTTKGELVRSILYPPPADFKFDQDSYKFIIILGIIALVGFIYTVVSKISRNMAAADIAIKALDIITIVVPPALPAAMTVGKLYALNRLKDNKIFCINSRVINVSGSVDCVCFDKTGTLTEDELDMWGIVPVKNSKICQPQRNVRTMESSNCDLVRGMATCHSLTSIDGRICGDPLDVKMFESTHWIFEDRHGLETEYHHSAGLLVVKPPQSYLESTGQHFEIEIVKQFQFSSTLQRMSVITKSSGTDSFEVFCKGSPEMIISLSNAATVPEDIHKELKEYTEQGYRVIAVATRTLDSHFSHVEIEKLHREDVEFDLELLGLIVLENKLKPQTTEVIKTLKSANMKVVMITGDNIQTAVHVANDCKIIDSDCKVIEVLATNPTRHEFATISYHVVSYPTWEKLVPNNLENGGHTDLENPKQVKYCFIVTGTTWANVVKYFPDLIPKIVAKGVVFARMSGAQKQHLVEELKNLGYYVAMCGDGANDCGALKAAHVGISLSEAESSVASPLTSQEPNISCTPKVIKEGRAALVTSFGVFKMMLCYSLTEFASVIILYTIDANLTSLEYLFIDVFLVLNFASTFGLTKAYENLDKVPPRTSLLSFIPLCSIISFMTLTVVFQVIAFNYIQTFDWFTNFVYNPVNWNSFYCYENYAVFSVSMFQYITMAVVFSKGKPYRKALYTNALFTISLLLMTLVCVYIAVYPADWLSVSTLELLVPPEYWPRIVMILMALANFIACIIVEDFLIEKVLAQFLAPKFNRVYKSKKRYLVINRELDNDTFWPPIVEDVSHMGGIIDEETNEQNHEINDLGIVNNGFLKSDSSENVIVTRC